MNFERQSSYERAELLACGHGQMFGEGNAHLPLPPMLMFDRITHISDKGGAYGKGEVIAELDIDTEQWFFACHFENDAVMPGCLGVDALWQLVGFFLGWKGGPGHGRALGSGEIRFTGQVTPEKAFHGYCRWSGRGRRKGNLYRERSPRWLIRRLRFRR